MKVAATLGGCCGVGECQSCVSVYGQATMMSALWKRTIDLLFHLRPAEKVFLNGVRYAERPKRVVGSFSRATPTCVLRT